MTRSPIHLKRWAVICSGHSPGTCITHHSDLHASEHRAEERCRLLSDGRDWLQYRIVRVDMTITEIGAARRDEGDTQ